MKRHLLAQALAAPALASAFFVMLTLAFGQLAVAQGGPAPIDPYGPKPSAPAPIDPYGSKPAPPADAPPSSQPASPVDPYGDPPPEPVPPPLDPTDTIDDDVARALYLRGEELLKGGDAVSARMLFTESLERSPRGSVSQQAQRRVAEINAKLGDPGGGAGGNPSGTGPLDPYGSAGGAASDSAGTGGQTDSPGGLSPLRRGLLLTTAGAVGLITGLAIAGPERPDESGLAGENEVPGSAILVGAVGAAAGVGLSYYFSNKYSLSDGQSSAMMSSATWGTLLFGWLGDAITGTESEPNHVWKFTAVGSLLGTGGGIWFAAKEKPSAGETAFINSLGMWGAGTGLLVGVGMQPPHGEAYSINGAIGATAGLGLGLLLRDDFPMSRRRTLWLDAGAAVGALAPWVLLYPLIEDGSTDNDEQVAGWLSVFTLGTGAGIAYYVTRWMDSEEGSDEVAHRGPPPPPALVQREYGGSWHAGAALPRPLVAPESRAPATHGGWALDLLSGKF